MFKVIFRIKNKETGIVTTTVSSGYIDTRVEALSYANKVKQEHTTSTSEVIDFFIIDGGNNE